jgi:hypothetical protein
MNDWWIAAVVLSFAAATFLLLTVVDRLQGARDERN